MLGIDAHMHLVMRKSFDVLKSFVRIIYAYTNKFEVILNVM